MRFVKFHGFGNDYLVLEADDTRTVASLNAFAKKICDRHYGAGSDGIVVLDQSTDAESDYVVRIFNPDGSEAGLSGNGTRCAAAYLYHRGVWSDETLRLNTRSGVMVYRFRSKDGIGTYWFDSELGQPKLDSASIPMTTDEPRGRVANYPLVVEGRTYFVTALKMGNPMCVLFVDEFESIDWRHLGRAIETHAQFPDRANVTFVRVIDRENIELRIWERGVGETFASGTCSCAAMIASAINDHTDRRVNVHMPGGTAVIEWRDDGEVVLTGRADVVYKGEWLAEV